MAISGPPLLPLELRNIHLQRSLGPVPAESVQNALRVLLAPTANPVDMTQLLPQKHPK